MCLVRCQVFWKINKYRCYRKDSVTKRLSAQEHLGSGITVPRGLCYYQLDDLRQVP